MKPSIHFRLLVLHQNFPGQFGHLVGQWSRCPGWEVRALGREHAPGLPGFAGLQRYRLARKVQPSQHNYLRQMEAATLHGQAVARELLKMRAAGYRPDAVLAHPGWGESLYVKDIFPDTRLVHLCEWYYAGDGADLGFDPEFPPSLDDRLRVKTWNALHTLNLTQCDAAVTPTRWQLSQHPAVFHPKITVQHEGIAADDLGPDAAACVTTPGGTVLRAGDPVVTYVARSLEPYRGFHIFMRALEKLQRRHPSVHALIVGGDDVSYGRRPPAAAHWREHMLREVTLDPARTHFLGKLPRPQYIKVLQVSAAHAYLSYPFVLSWSLLEAMACGARVVASDTAPVREVVRDGENGVLADFFDAERVATLLEAMLASGSASEVMRAKARAAAAGFSHAAALRGYLIALANEPAKREPPSAEILLEALCTSN